MDYCCSGLRLFSTSQKTTHGFFSNSPLRMLHFAFASLKNWVRSARKASNVKLLLSSQKTFEVSNFSDFWHFAARLARLLRLIVSVLIIFVCLIECPKKKTLFVSLSKSICEFMAVPTAKSCHKLFASENYKSPREHFLIFKSTKINGLYH